MQKKNPLSRGFFFWSGRPDSNRRPSPWQGDVLPTELLPRAHLPAKLLLAPQYCGARVRLAAARFSRAFGARDLYATRPRLRRPTWASSHLTRLRLVMFIQSQRHQSSASDDGRQCKLLRAKVRGFSSLKPSLPAVSQSPCYQLTRPRELVTRTSLATRQRLLAVPALKAGFFGG